MTTDLAPPTKAIKITHWKSLGVFSIFSILFTALHIAYQYYVLIPGEVGGSFVRGFGLAGTTLISASLASSTIFKWNPAWARYWRIRRYLGVSGFIFIFFHVAAATKFLFDFNYAVIFSILSPFKNPLIFGVIAYVIFFVIAITSTDGMMKRLTPKVWKTIHRFVYIAYISAIFHFIFINPALLQNPAGYFLLLLTAFVVITHIYWFIRTVMQRGWEKWATLVGIIIIITGIAVGWKTYKTLYSVLEIQNISITEQGVDTDVAAMKKFLEENNDTRQLSGQAVKQDANFVGSKLRSGSFKNLNYMSTGNAYLVLRNNVYYIMLDSNFTTPDGPDLELYLTKNSGPTLRSDIQDGVLLGKVKSTTGKQVYEIPLGTNINQFESVTIHCKAFNVPWSYAPFESLPSEMT